MRGKAHGLARGRPGLPGRRRRAASGSARRTERPARSGPGPAVRSSGRPSPGSCWPGCGPRPRPPGCSTSSAPAGSLLDAELMPWSAKAEDLLRSQYARRRRGGPARAARRRGRARAGRGRRPGRRRPARADQGEGRERRGLHAPPTAGTAGRSTGSTASGSRRSSFWPPRARATSDRPHAWHLDVADRLAAAEPELIATTRRLVRRHDRSRLRRPRRPPGGSS